MILKSSAHLYALNTERVYNTQQSGNSSKIERNICATITSSDMNMTLIPKFDEANISGQKKLVYDDNTGNLETEIASNNDIMMPSDIDENSPPIESAVNIAKPVSFGNISNCVFNFNFSK